MSDWLPIETAPKDQFILGYLKNPHDFDSDVAVIKWDGESWKVRPTRDMRLAHQATHWMPLPEPPQEQADE